MPKQTNEVIGYVAYHHSEDAFLHYNPETGNNFLHHGEAMPVSRSDVYRRIAAYLEQPDAHCDDFSVDPVYRVQTPTESAAEELGGLLESLCERHGIRIGLTQAQVREQLQKELRALESGDTSFLYAGLPRR